MEDYDDLGSYNGDVEHDMWVDYYHYQNTGVPDVFDEENIDDNTDELTTGTKHYVKNKSILSS